MPINNVIENTPIEQYKVGNYKVFVKRDDLFLAHLQSQGLPPLAKLRGARILLQRLKNENVHKVGVFDTRISKAGQGIAYFCKELELECMAGFPQLKGQPLSESHLIAQRLGATLFPLKAGRTAPMYHSFKKLVEEQKGYMLKKMMESFSKRKGFCNYQTS